MSSVQVRVTTFEYQSPNFAYYELFADETNLSLGAVENYAAFKLVFFADYAIHANLQFGDTWHYWIRAVYDNGATEGPLFYLGAVTISGTSDGTDDQTAAEVPYDDTETGLGAGNVQEAIEALAAGVSEGGGGSGDLVLITETITAGSQASVTFSSIPGTFRQLEIIALARGDTAAVSTGLRIQFNGDTGSNYDLDRENRFGSAEGIGGVSAEIAEISAATATANYASEVDCLIPNYIGTVFYKTYYSTSSMETSQAAGGILSQRCIGWWRSTAAITSILLFPAAGNFVDGSVFQPLWANVDMNALTFIKQHEGCKLQSYQDQGGVWTIGYGCTGHDIGAGLIWTQDQADANIAAQVASALTVVRANAGFALTEGQEAALASFVYNLGTGAFEKSTLLQKVKAKDFLGAAKEFVRWDHIGPMEVKGLLIRRLEEALLFLR